MKYVTLGKNMNVSALAFGCMGFSHAYGAPTDDAVAIKVMQAAVEEGYNFFDTAEVYGSYVNETLVGKALKPYRDKVVIATKFGVSLEQGTTGAPIPDSNPVVVRKALEGSLQRLGVDCIDLYYQHRVDPKVAPEEIASLMADFIKEGKIRAWGISQVDEDYLRRAHSVCPVTAIQNRYSMMARQYECLFPVLEELGITFVAFSPLANGLLSAAYGKHATFAAGDYRNHMPQFTAQAMDENQELFRLLHVLSETKGATPAQISLAWIMCKKQSIIPLVGMRKVSRLSENAGACDVVLTEAEVAAIDKALNNMQMSNVFLGSKPGK